MASLAEFLQQLPDSEVLRITEPMALDYFPTAPFVKNLVPHNNIYNYGRMQEVWLDR